MDGIDTQWVLCNKRALDKIIVDVLQTKFGCEVGNILEEFFFGQTNKRVLDSWLG